MQVILKNSLQYIQLVSYKIKHKMEPELFYYSRYLESKF